MAMTLASMKIADNETMRIIIDVCVAIPLGAVAFSLVRYFDRERRRMRELERERIRSVVILACEAMSGEWIGTYTQRNENSPMKCNLVFHEGWQMLLTGDGSDENGIFFLEGCWSDIDGIQRVAFLKRYQEEQHVHFSGGGIARSLLQLDQKIHYVGQQNPEKKNNQFEGSWELIDPTIINLADFFNRPNIEHTGNKGAWLLQK